MQYPPDDQHEEYLSGSVAFSGPGSVNRNENSDEHSAAFSGSESAFTLPGGRQRQREDDEESNFSGKASVIGHIPVPEDMFQTCQWLGPTFYYLQIEQEDWKYFQDMWGKKVGLEVVLLAVAKKCTKGGKTNWKKVRDLGVPDFTFSGTQALMKSYKVGVGRRPATIPENESIDVNDPRPPSLPSSCLLYTSPSPRDGLLSRMPSSA